MGATEKSSGDTSIRSDSCLLRKGALVVVDNTLWKGLVLNKVIESTPVLPLADYVFENHSFIVFSLRMCCSSKIYSAAPPQQQNLEVKIA